MLSVLRSGSGSLRSNTRDVLSVFGTRNATSVATQAPKAVAHDKEHFGEYVPPPAPEWVTKEYSMKERIETWDYVNSVYFGPERDMKNFSSYKMLEKPDATRLGIIPAEFFNFLAPKTGVSGGYIWLFGMAVWLHSKEHNPIDHYWYSIPGFAFGCWFYINHKSGDNAKAWFEEYAKREAYNVHGRFLDADRANTNTKMSKLERLLEECQIGQYYTQAKEEAVGLQLEADYRQRLQTVFQEVKSRLDYEADKSNLKRQFEQDHMVNWIVSNVRKSITPQQEKESIKSCIQTLQALGKQAAVA